MKTSRLCSTVLVAVVTISMLPPAFAEGGRTKGTDGCARGSTSCGGGSSSGSSGGDSIGYATPESIEAQRRLNRQEMLIQTAPIAIKLITKFLDWLLTPKSSPPAAAVAAVPPQPVDPSCKAGSCDRALAEGRNAALKAQEQRWRDALAPKRVACAGSAPSNPWDSGGATAAAVSDNPWDTPAKEVDPQQCEALWSEFTQQIDQFEAAVKSAWQRCNAQYSHGPAWNACAEGEITPAQERLTTIMRQRGDAANQCRGWGAKNHYADIQGRATAAKSLYDRLVGTAPGVQKIQNEMLAKVKEQHLDTLANADQVLCGMDQISENPWR